MIRMCCFRKKPNIVNDSTEPVQTSTKPDTNPKPTVISIASMKYFVERYMFLCEELNEANWRIPFHTVNMYEAIRIGGIIERIPRKTRAHKRLYKIYKKYELHIDKLLKPPPIDPNIVRVKPIQINTPVKPWWFTKVERFDSNGFLVSTQYLG